MWTIKVEKGHFLLHFVKTLLRIFLIFNLKLNFSIPDWNLRSFFNYFSHRIMFIIWFCSNFSFRESRINLSISLRVSLTKHKLTLNACFICKLLSLSYWLVYCLIIPIVIECIVLFARNLVLLNICWMFCSLIRLLILKHLIPLRTVLSYWHSHWGLYWLSFVIGMNSKLQWIDWLLMVLWSLALCFRKRVICFADHWVIFIVTLCIF